MFAVHTRKIHGPYRQQWNSVERSGGGMWWEHWKGLESRTKTLCAYQARGRKNNNRSESFARCNRKFVQIILEQNKRQPDLPWCSSFSGDHLQNTEVPARASGTIGKRNLNQKHYKIRRKRPEQYWQAAVKRSKESSQGSDKAKALSNGGVCQPPIAPQKSGEIV